MHAECHGDGPPVLLGPQSGAPGLARNGRSAGFLIDGSAAAWAGATTLGNPKLVVAVLPDIIGAIGIHSWARCRPNVATLCCLNFLEVARAISAPSRCKRSPNASSGCSAGASSPVQPVRSSVASSLRDALGERSIDNLTRAKPESAAENAVAACWSWRRPSLSRQAGWRQQADR